MKPSLAGLVGLLLLVGATWVLGQPAKDSALSQEIKAILEKHNAREERLVALLQKADKADAPKIKADLRALRVETASHLFGLIQKSPKDAAILPAVEFVVFRQAEQADKVLELLAEHQADSPAMGRFCSQLTELETTSPAAEKLMRAVGAKAANDKDRVRANLALVSLLATRADGDGVSTADREKLHAEALKLAAMVLAKHADVKIGDGTAGEEASKLLFQVRNLSVGRPALEIEGEDTDGKKFKLSDYRGKVVLLDFWGFWCGACVSMLPHEVKLVKQMEGRPFALVGVDSDEDLEEYKRLAKKAGVTWRCFKDQQVKDKPAISETWQVTGWPMLYLIDEKGVIRKKWLGAPDEKELDKAVEELVKEAEKK